MGTVPVPTRLQFTRPRPRRRRRKGLSTRRDSHSEMEDRPQDAYRHGAVQREAILKLVQHFDADDAIPGGKPGRVIKFVRVEQGDPDIWVSLFD